MKLFIYKNWIFIYPFLSSFKMQCYILQRFRSSVQVSKIKDISIENERLQLLFHRLMKPRHNWWTIYWTF